MQITNSTQNFSSMITAPVSAAEAVQKISNVAGWWGISFSGASERQEDEFVVKMGGDSFFNFTVAELIPAKKVVWMVNDCHMPWFADKKEWAQTRLVFDVSEHEGAATVLFTHDGLTPAVKCYDDCATGWTHWIQTSLSSYLATGQGVFRPPTK